MTLTSVSIVTITQYERFECLKNLYDLILLQDYSIIDEWIIVEGSQRDDHIAINSDLINEFIANIKNPETKYGQSKMKIVYLCGEHSMPLSNLRNWGNTSSTGDIIVCMDDDDYYFPTRVSHAVKMLNYSNCEIAGCTAMYMYDYFLHKLYKFRGYHKNHSTNNCMAFTREYLKTHAHKEGLSMAEEYSFTNGFTEPMVQLNPLKCIVVSSHDKNTYSKKSIIATVTATTTTTIATTTTTSEPTKTKGKSKAKVDLYEVTQKNISIIIPPAIFNRMHSIFLE